MGKHKEILGLKVGQLYRLKKDHYFYKLKNGDCGYGGETKSSGTLCVCLECFSDCNVNVGDYKINFLDIKENKELYLAFYYTSAIEYDLQMGRLFEKLK